MRISSVWGAGIVAAVASMGCGGASEPPPAAPAPARAPASAPPPPVRAAVQLSYLAPSDCPSVDGYLSHIRARSATLVLQPGEAGDGDSVDVRLDPDLEQPGWLGVVRIEGTRPLEREVRGEHCEDVVAALALITVLRLEGGDGASGAGAGTGAGVSGATGATGATGSSAPSGGPGAAPVPGPEARSPESAGAPAEPNTPGEPSASAPSAPVEPNAAPEPAAPSEPSAAPSAASATPSRDGEAEAETTPSAAAEPTPPPATSGQVQREAESEPPPLQPDEPITRPRSERVEPEPADETEEPETTDAEAASVSGEALQAQLVPTLALLGGYASVPRHAVKLTLAGEVRYGEGLSSWSSPISLSGMRGTDRVDAADLSLTLLIAQVGLCPPALLAESWGWLRVCANVRGGAVRVHTSPRIPELQEGTAWRPWLAVGPSLELGIPLSGSWAVRASADLAVQLVRDNFNVPLGAGPDAESLTLYRPEAVSIEGTIGVGYSF